MGGQVSTEDKAIVNVWTLMLSKRGIKYYEQALQTLLQFCKSQGVETTTEGAFSIKNWEQTGKLIFESASKVNETARSIMTTWRLVLDTLKLIKAEWNAKAAAEAPWVPPTEISQNDGVPGGAVGGIGAASGLIAERVDEKPEREWLSSKLFNPAEPLCHAFRAPLLLASGAHVQRPALPMLRLLEPYTLCSMLCININLLGSPLLAAD